MGLRAKESWQLLETIKGKEPNSLLEAPEGTGALLTL